jgi:hypothetical protein
MNSKQLRNLCLMVAKMGQMEPENTPTALLLMQTQFFGEIAYQLAVLNERNAPRELSTV